MCGRYTLGKTPDSLLDYFHLHGDVPAFHLSYNIAPTQSCPIVFVNSQQQRVCELMRWGLVPSWSKSIDNRYNLINARAETISEKPSFKQAYRFRRCLVPANGFYEWKKTADSKQPFYIGIGEKRLFAMAGIWEQWHNDEQTIQSFSIITTTANKQMQSIHERMPVILAKDNYDKWLLSEPNDSSVATLMIPYLQQPLEIYPVSKKINSPKNNDAALMNKINL